MESDSELVRQSRSGCVEAFGKLCRRYERTAVAVALSILANWHSAEDAVQQSLLIAFRKLPALDDGAKCCWFRRTGPGVRRLAPRGLLAS